MLSVSIIFVITLLDGSRAAAWSALSGGILSGRSGPDGRHVDDEPSDVQDLLARASMLERVPVTPKLENFWDTTRFLTALDAPEPEGDVFAVFFGRLEQVTPDEFSLIGPAECFVRVPEVGPVIVLASPDDLESCAISDQVVVEGWFRRVEQARARDGQDRRYPVFVARLRGRSGAQLQVEPSLVVGVSCLMLGGVWWIIRRRMGRSSPGRGPMAPPSSLDVTPNTLGRDEVLPTDPARALDELARRGDDSR